MKAIEIVPYNPDWPKQFEIEAAKIKESLGDNCIAIYHIGSTSVPGLAAKPKIDIIVVVKDPASTITSLEAIGIQYKGEYNIPLHYGFSRRGDVDLNLHVYEDGNPEIELNLCFRDYLRKNAVARDEYMALKQNLLQEEDVSCKKSSSMFSEYTLGKDVFIRTILRQAGFNRLRFLKCTHYGEWNVARQFRQTYFFDKVPVSDPYEWTFKHPEHEHEHVVLYQGTEIIGYAHIQFWKEYRSAIRIIVIDETKRNQGFGRYFVALIEKWLKAQGYKSIHIESSPESLQFYKCQGYSEMPFNDPDGYKNDSRDISLGKYL
ncbi:MAG: GNAT family N-acetyltransferase [Candidatus Amoebophilus sp. 36-38]|mgnify:CR=1 FL=1|nr:MAG: GNAT family N-acetyltransferase [Candidatus Amoebophilus sp. 36-38]